MEYVVKNIFIFNFKKMVSKRIVWFKTIKNWIIGGGAVGVITVFALFSLLAERGDIDILDYSGDIDCWGYDANGNDKFWRTGEYVRDKRETCLAWIRFKANVDVFIQPISEKEQIWAFETEPNVKSIRMYKGRLTDNTKGMIYVNLSKSCTGTWCGLSNKEDKRKFVIAFRKGREYKIYFEVEKYNPRDNIKWSFTNEVDPEFLAVLPSLSESESIKNYIKDSHDNMRERDENIVTEMNINSISLLKTERIAERYNKIYYRSNVGTYELYTQSDILSYDPEQPIILKG